MDAHAQIEIRDNHMRSQKRFTIIALVGLGVSLVVSLLVNLALILGFNSYPKTTFLWTQDAKAVCEATPLTEPNISQALLADFAARAAISVHTYDYINWRENLSYAVQNYFTPVGGRYFIDAFARSNILRQVQRNFYVVSAVTDGHRVDYVNSPDYIYLDGHGVAARLGDIETVDQTIVWKPGRHAAKVLKWPK